jgi:hypothetical protein
MDATGLFSRQKFFLEWPTAHTLHNKTGNVRGTCNVTVMRSCKHYCSGKAISITYSECVFLVLVI